MIRKVTSLIGLGLLVGAVGYSQTPSQGGASQGGQTPSTQSPNSPQTPDSNRPSTQTPDSNRPSTQSPNSSQTQDQTPGQTSPRTSTASASDKTYEGRLTKVDTAAKTITVATLSPQEGDTKEMTFKYNDQTVVVGGDRTVQALAGKTGSTLKITFQPDRENTSSNMASRIEISDKP